MRSLGSRRHHHHHHYHHHRENALIVSEDAQQAVQQYCSEHSHPHNRSHDVSPPHIDDIHIPEHATIVASWNTTVEEEVVLLTERSLSCKWILAQMSASYRRRYTVCLVIVIIIGPVSGLLSLVVGQRVPGNPAMYELPIYIAIMSGVFGVINGIVNGMLNLFNWQVKSNEMHNLSAHFGSLSSVLQSQLLCEPVHRIHAYELLGMATELYTDLYNEFPADINRHVLNAYMQMVCERKLAGVPQFLVLSPARVFQRRKVVHTNAIQCDSPSTPTAALLS